MIGMEELKTQLRRELLGFLKPIFESQGIQFLDIASMMSEEECRSNFAFTTKSIINTKVVDQVAMSGWPHGLEVAMSGPGGIEEPPWPSLESDTIDNLSHPIARNLVVLVGGSYRMEVRKWIGGHGDWECKKT
jgi:hypothetical protein